MKSKKGKIVLVSLICFLLIGGLIGGMVIILSRPSGDTEKTALLIDIAEESSSAALTHELIEEKMDAYAELGIKQIYFVPIPDTYAVTDSCQGSVLCDASLESDHMHRTVHATLDPNLAFITACRKAGMEANVIYRPYEGGGSVTVPTGATVQFSMGDLNTLGGKAVFSGVDAVGFSNGSLVSSRDLELGGIVQDQNVKKIEVVFAAESFSNRTGADEVKKYSIDASAEAVPQIWISNDNINYTLAPDCSYEVQNGTRMMTDPNGNVLGEMSCKIVSIDVSDRSGKFYALAFENGNELYTIPFSMINAYNGKGELVKTTKSVYTRNPHSDSLLNETTVPSDYSWGAERKPIHTSNKTASVSFKAWGFEFQYGGIGADFGDGWTNGYVYGLAIGSQNYLRGNLSESDSKVREYWLGEIDRFYAMGAETVIISLENSGGMVYNYTEYGFNYQFAKKYRELYGVDILTEDFDYLKLMEIRGSFFAGFLKKVDELADKNGKKWGVEMLSALENPTLDDDLNGLCHYKMSKIVFDWKEVVDLCDTVLIKDYQYEDYDKNVATEIRSYASEAQKQVLIMGYDFCGADEKFVAAATDDELNDRIILDSAELITKLFQSKMNKGE